MEWKTVFDITKESALSGWIFILILPFVFPAVFAVIAFGSRKHDGDSKKVGSMIARIIGLLVFSIPIMAVLSAYRAHTEAFDYLKDNYAQGKCKQVEGPVADFDPMPSSGHRLETFKVNGASFSYSDFDLTNPGFHNATSHGGPIHNGLRVRAYYMPSPEKSVVMTNWIARLDVAE